MTWVHKSNLGACHSTITSVGIELESRSLLQSRNVRITFLALQFVARIPILHQFIRRTSRSPGGSFKIF